MIHGAVCILQQRAYVAAVGRVHGNANAHPRIDFKIAHHDGLPQRFYDALRRGCCCGLVGILKQQGELVSTKTRKYGMGPCRSDKPNSHLFQQIIASGVPDGIVDDLEIVNIDESNRKAAARCCAGIQRTAQTVAKYGTVGQLGELVVGGKKFYAALGNGDLFYIGKYADIVGDSALRIAHNLDVEPFKVVSAVLFAVPYLALPTAGGEQLIPHVSVKFFAMAARGQLAGRFANDFGLRKAGQPAK